MVDLREELLRRLELDQALMRKMFGKRVDPALKEQLDATIRDNTEWLRGVIRQWGWPGRTLVGEDGADAAWLLAQHSDHDPAFQRECLNLLDEAVAQGEASKKVLAYLTDRVQIKERGTQTYGTQFRVPIDDPEGVNQRRKAMGLGSLTAYRMLTPPLFAMTLARRVVMDAWRRGWETARMLWPRSARTS